ncbi:GPI-anchored wall transfer protein [Parastagonospora nodorum]|uniref:GPI-anchored wall transfer protein n=1 Tax=Phaeosphaeria nodorum (strain SN15 / ATCC MYA-4574 / FGSC 10173) TaxID=321614 RepID=A0A7U2FD50_PHANO|nr:GPI-anchored wall transfer protein [Parastagonospora nodorum]QRD03061.1 GPI-anchored wall transfer protein [Parastagonospora nodorum SN15]KAH3938023.1 GPI-anchored wall transfer protein [Parastagonospora nodorum]KAH3994158.1 GPI-anchored wall transfer protein [Parastagonospora nodorum]KAH4013599.1 GPI-anchored wall transfer protein [Parastagonospora nodorum]
MAKTYKQLKEAWVSGHTGSSVADVNSVSLAMPLSILLWSVVQSRMRLFTPYTVPAFLVDFLLNCGVTLFATTIYSSTPWVLNLLLLLPAVILVVLEKPVQAKKEARPQKKDDNAKDSKPDPLPVKPFITNYRGAMMVITCVAILAVDFRVFPRRFAKVENWGTSLMDMGVGSFVFTAGVVSVRSSLKEGTGRRPPLSQRLLTSIRHSIPLLVLGTIRLISVKGLDYAEHVTEYGIHWNFFFTLGFLPPFVALFQTFFDLVPSYAILSCTLAALYEIALDWTSLGSYILIAPRTNLLSKNREGIFSFIGYLAIFLAGQSLGSIALPRQQALPKNSSLGVKLRKTILGQLAIASLLWTALFYFSTSYYGLRLSVSRRIANLPYFLWVSAFNSYQITICCGIETLLFPNLYKAPTKSEEKARTREATSSVLYAFNRNGLAVFLVANLLTGLVNMTMPTLHMGVLESMGVLVAYTVAVAGVAVGLDWWDVSVKL